MSTGPFPSRNGVFAGLPPLSDRMATLREPRQARDICVMNFSLPFLFSNAPSHCWLSFDEIKMQRVEIGVSAAARAIFFFGKGALSMHGPVVESSKLVRAVQEHEGLHGAREDSTSCRLTVTPPDEGRRGRKSRAGRRRGHTITQRPAPGD